jgi:hypothetical protein
MDVLKPRAMALNGADFIRILIRLLDKVVKREMELAEGWAMAREEFFECFRAYIGAVKR